MPPRGCHHQLHREREVSDNEINALLPSTRLCLPNLMHGFSGPLFTIIATESELSRSISVSRHLRLHCHRYAPTLLVLDSFSVTLD